jgi:DNA-binding protein Fis
MAEAQGASEKILSPEELMRLFYKYPVNGFPLLDDDFRFSGILLKRYVANSMPEFRSNRMDARRIIEKHVFCPAEGEIVRLIFGDKKIQPFPVLHRQGRFIGVWKLSEFFRSFDAGDFSGMLEYELLFTSLPFPVVILDEKSRLLASSHAFNQNILPALEEDFAGKKLRSLAEKSGLRYNESQGYLVLDDEIGRPQQARLVPVEQKNGRQIVLAVFTPGALQQSAPNTTPNMQSENDRLPHKFAGEEVQNIPYSTLVDAVEKLERSMIKNALKDCLNNISQTASMLDIPRQTLQYKIAKYGIRV